MSSVPESSAFVDSYMKLMDWMRSRILSEKDSDDLLEMARFYGLLQCSNFSGVYEDSEVEEAVARRIFQNRRFDPPRTVTKGAETVLIASELYDSGGHSRVVLNWLRAFEQQKSHRLVVSRVVSKGFANWLREGGYPYHVCTTRGINKINEILRTCANAGRIVLHIHPDDIVSAIAAKFLASAGKPIIFYNHADHGFSYGISSSDVVGEVSRYGIALNKRTGRAKRSCFLGIPIQGSGPADVCTNESGRNRIVLSGGAAYKYAPAEINFADFLDQLLSARKHTTVLLAGSTGKEPWWEDRSHRWGENVEFLGQLAHEDYLQVMASADVYVDSFPVTGGTAFPEALLNGKSVAGLAVGMQGYSPVDELRAKTIPDLVARVKHLLDGSEGSIEEMQFTRNKAKEVHSLEAFRIRVQDVYSGICPDCPWDAVQELNTHWLESRWQQEKVFRGEAALDSFSLPISFLLAYLRRASSVIPMSHSKYLAYSAHRILVRVLPPAAVRRLMSTRKHTVGSCVSR